jgi:isopentenyldiphosphate isomerase/intracellular septation protein A
MSRLRLLLSFFPGFAPILIYIAVEALWGETAGLAAGMALGIGEFLYVLIRERRVDTFILVDTILLAAMGALSWALSDPVFIELKPAVAGAALAFMIIIGCLGPHQVFLPYVQSKMNMGELPEAVADKMLKMIAGFGFLTLAHSLLTAIAALFWTKEVWNFIAGAFFLVLAAVYMAFWTIPAFVRRAKMKRRIESGESADEILPVVDENGAIIGKAPRQLCHRVLSGNETLPGMGEKLLHPVVRLWISDGHGGFWMQKRSMSKLVQPGKWDCAVGGHIAFGESAHAALRREATEEIGLEELPPVSPRFSFIWETPIERELVYVSSASLSPATPPVADRNEVDEIRVWTAGELKRELAKTPEASELTELARVELAKGLL